MRPIKFRAMNETGNWVYFSIWNINPSIIKEKFKNLCEFTGLLDKNGFEIWEGDVIKWRDRGNIFDSEYKDCFSEVQFKYARWYAHPLGSYGLRSFAFHGYSFETKEDCEVIGNIHQNPELMKGEL